MCYIDKLTMISSKTVDNVQVIPQSLLIFRTCKTWTDFALGPQSCQVVSVHEKMMRANFASNRQTLINRTCDRYHTIENGTTGI